MFQSYSGPDNQWVISQGGDGQGLYDSGPLPHSWPQFCPPQPSGTIHHSSSQHPYGGAYTRAQTPVWCQRPKTWRVGSHNRMLWQRCINQNQSISHDSVMYQQDEGSTAMLVACWGCKPKFKSKLKFGCDGSARWKVEQTPVCSLFWGTHEKFMLRYLSLDQSIGLTDRPTLPSTDAAWLKVNM